MAIINAETYVTFLNHRYPVLNIDFEKGIFIVQTSSARREKIQFSNIGNLIIETSVPVYIIPLEG